MWPGFGENARVMKWIIDRVNGRVGAKETPIGLVPEIDDFDTDGLAVPRKNLEKLFEFKPEDWKGEARQIEADLARFGRHIPHEIRSQIESLRSSLK